MTKPISPLRQRMLDDMKIRNMSPNTQTVFTVFRLTLTPSGYPF